ncbi:MAG TPA: 5-formyltetrahydrofolate cyclo-ligase [Stellaceae bacterium]|nr:5-formyltetrahydrofolate cyclo-ligase [Stellaceae bacterium]
MSGAPQSWTEIARWRRDRRQEFQAARAALSLAEHRAKSAAVAAGLEPFAALLAARRVGIYWPIRREFDPLPYARRLIDAGGRVALPVVVAQGQPLQFRDWAPGARLASGAWDIPYPAEGEAVTPEALIVPLLGFDEAGYRLGYGAGFYDRTFAAFAAKPFAIGVGFELGRLATLYPQPHDIAMDRIVTEAGVFAVAAGNLLAIEGTGLKPNGG